MILISLSLRAALGKAGEGKEIEKDLQRECEWGRGWKMISSLRALYNA
jgi:hypothetical protein